MKLSELSDLELADKVIEVIERACPFAFWSDDTLDYASHEQARRELEAFFRELRS